MSGDVMMRGVGDDLPVLGRPLGKLDANANGADWTTVDLPGKTVLEARQAIKDQGGKFPLWFSMAPGHR